jgi:hypothetical protein
VKGEEFDKARDKAHDKAYEIQRSGGLNPFQTGSNYSGHVSRRQNPVDDYGDDYG